MQHNNQQDQTTSPATSAGANEKPNYKLRLNQPDFWNTPNPEMEEKLLSRWDTVKVNALVAHARENAPTYWLLDGPPYANGDAHLGHLLNKTLKDFNARFYSVLGQKVVWRAGWDCHGLPLELAVEKKNGPLSKTDTLSFMGACRAEASTWQSAQKTTMSRLGLLTNFESPWLTMDPQREAKALDLLRQLWVEGLLVERHSPVHWCPACQSALAASELEKMEKTRNEAYFAAELTSDSVARLHSLAPSLMKFEKLHVLAWTTTPWTVFANTAFAYPETGSASVVSLKSGKNVLMSSQAKDNFVEKYPELLHESGSVDNVLTFETLNDVLLEAVSPMSKRLSRLVSASFVSLTEGTGFVHVAPAFGPDDFELYEKENLPLVCHVSTGGRLVSTDENFGKLPDGFEGLTLEAASEATLAWLENEGSLVHTYAVSVEQQACWRHKKAVFYRASQQWALDLEKGFTGCDEGLAERAKKAVEDTVFLPDDRAKTPLLHMLATRRFWTLSRDRVWGLPLPFFRHKDTGALHPRTNELWVEVCNKVKVEGVEAWARQDTPEGYVKSTQVVDVWFDSGSAWYHANEQDLQAPDMGVEGRDQTRGWFLSSFLLHAFKSDKPAFKHLMTHSFVVGDDGKKLSKSSGGGGAALDPKAVFNKEGADAFRLWVCAQNVGDEARWGKTALKQATQDVKDWRSFLRFMLANMQQLQNCEQPELTQMDKLALSKAAQARDAWVEHMKTGKFNQAMLELNAFRLWSSTEWFELAKRMLYCAKDGDKSLVSMQWALQEVFVLFTRMLAVVVPYAAEEAYLAWPNHPEESVFVGTLPLWSANCESMELKSALTWRKNLLPLVERARAYVEKGTPVTLAFESTKLPSQVTTDVLRDWFGTCYVDVNLPEEAFSEFLVDSDMGVRAGKTTVTYQPYRCNRCRTYFGKPLSSNSLCEQCVLEMV